MYIKVFVAGDPLYELSLTIGQGVKSMIILKTAQNFFKTKFPSGQLKMLQKKAQWQMNRVIDNFPYIY